MARVDASIRAMAESDNDLVERHRRGDPQAFEQLYVEFSSLVYNLSLRLSGDPEEAADLSQETFLKIHRYLNGFSGRSSLKTWIYSVTLNCCRSRFRREATKKKLSADLTELSRVEDLPDRDRNPEEQAMSKSAAGRVTAALGQIEVAYGSCRTRESGRPGNGSTDRATDLRATQRHLDRAWLGGRSSEAAD